ncbi:MAG: hypothetical protein R8G34_19615 [Paracoccaceae bacterium]|nr:hypothetical protein [Paracoccaceae bacterium]
MELRSDWCGNRITGLLVDTFCATSDCIFGIICAVSIVRIADIHRRIRTNVWFVGHAKDGHDVLKISRISSVIIFELELSSRSIQQSVSRWEFVKAKHQ